MYSIVQYQVTLPGHADYPAQGGGKSKEIAEEKACDELVQYLQVRDN